MPYGSAFVSVCFLKNSPLPTKTLDLRQAGPQLPRGERSEKSGRSIMSPSNPRSVENNGGGGGGKNYIEHQVSKMDTLAGVAIKYGVEVSNSCLKYLFLISFLPCALFLITFSTSLNC